MILQERLTIKLSGETVYDNTGKSLMATYKDVWLKPTVRNNMVEDGIGSLAIRKKISGDGAQNTDQAAATFYDVLGTKQKMQLGYILKHRGLHAGYDFRYEITLPQADKIMESQTGQMVAGYELQNLELQYETIEKLAS